MKQYKIAPEFKEMIIETLKNKKFSVVYKYMDLLIADRESYSEQEVDAVLNFLGEMPYIEVHEIFRSVKEHVSEVTDEKVESN